MNIFVLHLSPKTAAEYHCDKHCVKMILELGQILCVALQHKGLIYKQYPSDQIEWDIGTVGYRKTHENHPASKWVRQSDENFNWAWHHFLALSEEYTKRYQKIHMTTRKMKHMASITKLPLEADINQHTPFVQCMPEKYRIPNDAVTAYRNYYIHEKKFAQWKYTTTPKWFHVQ